MVGVTVLIADDSEDTRYIVTRLLRLERVVDTVLEAKDGAEAIAVVRQARPQVVIIDYMMPRLDGLQATRLIKEEWPETRVIVITSIREKSYERDAFAYGAEAFIDKSHLADELLPTLQRLLGQHPS